MRLLSLAALLAAVLALAACGSSSEEEGAREAVKTLGAESDSDVEAAAKALQAAEGFSKGNIAFINALAKEDEAAARTAVDEMVSTSSEGLEKAKAVEGAKLRGVLDRYIGTMSEMATTYERYVDFVEAGERDPERAARLGQEITAVAEKGAAAEKRFVTDFQAALPPEEREKFGKQYGKELDERFEELPEGVEPPANPLEE